MRNKRQAVIVSLIFFMYFGQTAWANDSIPYEPIPEIQADSLGILLTQTFEGRIHQLILWLMMSYIKYRRKMR